MHKHVRGRTRAPGGVLGGVLQKLKVFAQQRQGLGGAALGVVDRALPHRLHGCRLGGQAGEAHSGHIQPQRGLCALSRREDGDVVLLGRAQCREAKAARLGTQRHCQMHCALAHSAAFYLVQRRLPRTLLVQEKSQFNGRSGILIL